MKNLSANAILPLIEALPDSEKAVLRDKLNELFTKPKEDTKKAPKGFEKVPEKFWPENKERLIYDILHGK